MNTERPQSKSLDDDYFVRNAIYCFLHYFPDHKWAPIYKELAKRETFNIVKDNDSKRQDKPERKRKVTIIKDSTAE